jgi:glycine/D-amino acid oxidase-like deaminating enzyme
VVPGYYEAILHSSVTLGPLVGYLLAQEILIAKPESLLIAFSPDRFARG